MHCISYIHSLIQNNFTYYQHKEKHKSKTYNFSSYSSNATSSNNDSGSSKKSKYGSRKTSINNKGYEETDPIQNIDTKYSFDENNGQIIIDLKNDKK